MILLQRGIGVLTALIVLMGGFSYVDAAVLRSGDVVSVPQDATVEGDLYTAGNEVNISGMVTGDVYVVGGAVTINGEVKGDVVILGGTASIHGVVGDDVRIVGGKAVVANKVGGDVLVLGGTLAVLSTSHVTGEVLFYGGRAEIEGEVQGAFHARAESLVVNGKVGSIDVTFERELQLGNAAVVAGDVVYQSSLNLSRDPGSLVSGTVMQKKSSVDKEGFWASHITVWFVALFSSLVFVLLFRDFFLHILVRSIPRLGLSGLLGLGVLLVTPIALGLLLISVLGMLVGAVVLLLYLALCIVSLVMVHVFVGAFLAKVVVGDYKVNWSWTVIGVMVTQAALLVPIVGMLLVSVLFVLVVGMLVHQLYVVAYS